MPGGNLVPLLNVGHRLPESSPAAGAVLLDRHQPRHGREDARLVDAAALTGGVEVGLAQLLPQDGQLGLPLLQARLNILFELLLAAFGFLQCENVLARIDGGNQFVLLDFKLGALDGEAGFEQLDLVLALANFQIRLGFRQ